MPVRLDPSSRKAMSSLMVGLGKVAPDVAKKTRKRFRTAALPVLNDARSRQRKRSGELRRKTRINVVRGSVQIRSSAEHARISEFGGRHPLWGDRDNWVAHRANPAIWPAVQQGRERFLQEAGHAVQDALREAGFK